MSETKMSPTGFQELAQEANMCLLEGFHAVKHALRFGAKIKYGVGINKSEILRLTRELAPDIEGKIQNLVDEWPQGDWVKLGLDIPTGIVAIAEKKKYILKDLELGKPIVFLEEPRNLGNVGAVIRVAAAANAGGVVMSGTIDPWSRAVIRGAAGLQFALPVVSVDGVFEIGRPIYALDPEGTDLGEINLPNDAILAFGTERGGLSEELLKRADHRVAIPMRDKVSSMNLATSVAVALYANKLSRRS